MPGDVAISMRGVSVRAGDARILDGIDWTVSAGERWVVLGPNGAGKTTLLQLVTAYTHPTEGEVEVLGHRLGGVDVRVLRRRIAVASGALARTVDPRLTAREIVTTGRRATLAPWWDDPDPVIEHDAECLLAEAGLGEAADRPFAKLSDGERQRVLLARMRMTRADLWVFDEPAAGLDLGARERLVTDLAAVVADPATPAVLFVTHHLEEIPPGFTHALLLSGGRVVASGHVEATLTSDRLGAAFGISLLVERRGGRWTARGA